MKNDRIVYFADRADGDDQGVTGLLQSLGIICRHIPGGISGLPALRDREPGCLLIDIDAAGGALGSLGGLPIGGAAMPVVVMSAHAEVAVVVDAMRLGACDFLTKPLDRGLVAASLVRVFDRLGSAREAYWRRQQARALIAALSDREHDVLKGLLAGRANKALAFALGISIRTVEMHRSHLMTKLGVQSLAQAIRVAFDAGIAIDVPGDPVDIGNADCAAPDGRHPAMARIVADRCYG